MVDAEHGPALHSGVAKSSGSTDFPCWKTTQDGVVLFVTDETADAHGIAYVDGVGHSAIDRVWPRNDGRPGEGFPCPRELARAIRAGKMRRLAAAAGYSLVRVNSAGRLDSDDGPALIWSDGSREWWMDGRRHRVGGPAGERADGSRWWYQCGSLHRDDGPAYEPPA